MVDYIGFNFVPTSKRRVDIETAQTLSHSFTGRKVGVFQNAALPEVLQTLQIVDLDIIQLHGEEDPEYIAQLRSLIPAKAGISCWKAFTIDPNFDSKILPQYSKNCERFLFDGASPGSGTQISDTDWLLSATNTATKLQIPFGIAGGVNSSTITELLQKFPEASFLDTASGVEVDGHFSADQLRQMIKLCRDE